MRYVCPAALAALSILTPAAMFGQLTISNYQLVSQQVVSLTTTNYTYTAQVSNTGAPIASVTATVASMNPYAVRIQPNAGTLTFGPVATNGHATSTNSFTILINRTASPAFNWADLQWSFQTTANAPVANAGPNQSATLHQLVTLDGSGSTNPSGVGTLTYQWAFVSRPPGSSTVLANQTAVHPTFSVDVAGTYVIQLTVNNGTASSTANVTVTTADTMPVANAGPNQTVTQGATVTLNGASSSDSNGNPMTFLWTLTSVPGGSAAALNSPTAVFPTFVADRAGSYTAQLVVNDGVLNSNPGTVTISTSNSPPVANAGSNQVVNIGSTVQLDGSNSTDTDGDPLTYSWSLITLPNNSQATLSNPTAVKPTFVADLPGTYVAQLIVHDVSISSSAVTVTITTNAPLAPTANAGPNQTVVQDSTVQLSGGGTDPQNYQLTYLWSFTSRPLHSTATLTGATTATPTFFADQPGVFTVQLVVNDGFLSSNPALTGSTVTITTSDLAPTANAGPPQTIAVGTTVTLNGSASLDLNGDSLTYSWTFNSRPNGSTAALTGATTVSPTFVPDVAGVYVAQLIVTDSYGTISNPGSTVTITATQTPTSITASSGTPQTANTFTLFALPLVATVKDLSNLPIQGVEVTFTAPGSGASGTFSNSSTTIQVATDVNGNATALFTANGTASGTAYIVTANVSPALGTAASFSLTNTQAPAASISVTSGSNQSAQIQAAFGAPLVATVLDATSHPVPNVMVTFLAPGSGASGTFAGANTAITNVSGVATSAVFTANSTVGGPYPVNAAVSGVGTPASFFLTNTVGAAASITATAGTPQSVTNGTAFAPFVVLVKDTGGNAVNGAIVTFAAPGSGPGGTFAGNVNTATTNSSGVATSAVFTANTTAGAQYTVTATVSGVATPASFLLTNTVGAAASVTATSGTPQSVGIGTAFAPLVVTVKDTNGNPVGTGTVVTFTAPGSGASGTFAAGANTATTNASGVATSAIFTANNTAGPQYTVAATVSGVATPANFLLTNTAGAAASITTTSGTPQSVTEGTAFAPLVATVKDSGGNLVSGVTVTFTAPSTGPSGTFAGAVNTASTNASGVATSAIFTANSTAGAQYTVAATVSGVATPANFLLTNTVGAAASITTTSGTPQSVANGTAFAPFVVTVKDSGGNPVGTGTVVTFTAPTTGASGTFAGAVNTATTNASGVATSAVFTANTTVGPQYTVSASASGVTTPASFLLTNAAGSPASIAVTSGSSQSVVEGTAAASLVATVKDSNGNVVGSGVTVTFTAPALTGASGTFANGTITTTVATNASGVATATTYTANGTLGGPYNVAATVSGAATPANFALTNTVGPAASITATSGGGQMASISNPFAALLVATVKDSGGNPVSNAVVTFTAPSSGASGAFGNGTITTTATTSAAGVATSTAFTANGTGGTYSVNATVSGVSTPAPYSLTNSVGLVLQSGVQVSVGGTQALNISLAVAPTSSVLVTLTSGSPSIIAFNGNASVSIIIPANSMVPASMPKVSGLTFGSSVITAAATGYPSVTTTVVATDTISFSPSTVTISGDVTSPAASYLLLSSAAPTPITLNLSSSNTAVATVPLTVIIPANSSNINVPVTGVSGGMATITASNTSLNIAATTLAVTVNAAQITTTQLSNGLLGAPYSQQLTATGGSGTYTWSLASGSTLPTGMTLSTGGLLGGTPGAITPQNGTPITFKITDTSSPVQTATATLTLLVVVGTPATIVPNAGTTPQSTTDTTAFATQLAVTVKDVNSFLVPNATVTFTAPSSGASGTFVGGASTATANTNSSGIATSPVFTANSTLGSYTVNATVSPVATPAAFNLTNAIGPASTIAVNGTSTQSATEGANFANPLVVTVKDVGGNVISGATVTYTIVPNGSATGTFVGGVNTAITNVSGVATSAVFTAGATTGTYTVTAASGSATGATFTLTNGLGGAASITITSGNNQSAAAGSPTGAAFPNLVATVKDSGGNPVPGVTVTFAAPAQTLPSVTFTTNPVTTDSNGNATVTATANTHAGPSYTVTATATGVATPASFTLTNTSGPASQISVSSGSPQNIADGAAFAPLVALVRDSGGNPVNNATVTFTIGTATGATASFSGTNTAATNASGLATSAGTLTANNVVGGPYTVTAAVSGVSTPASFTLTNVVGGAATITVNGGSPQSGPISSAFGIPLVAKVVDQGGNVVSGVVVTFQAPATGASGTFLNGTTTTTAATGSNGLATASTFTANGTDNNPSTTPYIVTATAAGVSTPANFSLTNLVGTAASMTINGGSNQGTQVGTQFTNALSVIVKDSGGNPVSGVTVTFTAPLSPNPGATFVGSSNMATAITGANGIATTSVAPTANNVEGSNYTVTATANPSLSASFTLTNNAGAPASIAPVAASNNQTASVGAAYSPLQVTVKDGNGNNVPGITVTFAAVANGAVSGTFGSNPSTTALTNASGMASATVTANTKAGTFTVTASVASPSLTTTFNLTSTALSASAIAATSGTGQNVAINTNFAAPLVATVTDIDGNPISGVTVVFAAPAGSVPSATFTPSATATTGAAGTATVTAHANAFASGTAYTVTATATGVATPASFLLTNNAGPAANIAITGGNNQSVGIGTAYAALSVTVTDSGNNPVSNATVTFTPATVGGSTATFAGGVNTATTNALGVATTTAVLTANSTKGTFTIGVNSGSATLTTPFQETNVSGPAASIALSAPTSQSVAINTAFASPMIATVTDSGGNPVVTGTTVTFTAGTVSNATGTFSTGATATAATNASGVATAPTFTANSTAGGPYLVTVSAGSAPTKTFSMTNTAGAPASFTIGTGNNQSAVVGAAYATAMTVTVKDAGGNVVPSASVIFTAPTAGAGIATGLFGATNTTTVTTSAQGVATVAANALTAGTVAGPFNVAVTASTGNATAVNFVMTNLAGAAASIVASGSSTPQSAAIGAAFTNPLVVTVKDANGNPVNNQTVTFAAPVQTVASGTFAGGLVTASTNSAGVATSAAFTANTIVGGPYNVNATVSGVSTPAAFALTNTAGLPASITKTSSSDNQSQTVGNPGNAFANPLIVTVKDVGGNGVNGAVVTFTAPASTGASGTFAGSATATATTSSSGVATSPAYTTNTHAGADAVVVSVSTGNAPTQTFNLTNAPSVATTVAATSGGGQNVPISTLFPTPLVATVTDSFGNPVGAGTNVTFSVLSVGANGQSASSQVVPTNASGVATTTTVTANNKAGAYSVTATGQGLNSVVFNITNIAGAASSIAISSGTGQTATVSTAYSAPLIVIVKDAGGNPVTTGSVQFSITSTPSGGMFSPNPATLNASGQAQTTLTANGSAGTVTVQATVSGTSITLGSNTFTETNTAGAPATIAVNGGTPQTTHIGTEFGSPLSALVKDANGNPVSGVTVIFTSQSAAGKVIFADDPSGVTSTAVTASNGIATSYPVSAGGTPLSAAVTVLGNTSPTAVATPATYLLTPSGTGSSSGSIAMTATSGGNLIVGQNMVTEVQINLTSAPASAVNVTATADGVNVMLGQNAPGVQTEQIGFAAGVTSQTIYVQALSNKNVTGNITFDAPGYTSGTGNIQVMPSGFILSVDGSTPPEDITSLATSEGVPTTLSVYAVQLDANNNYVAVGTLRGGTFSASIPVSVVGPAVGSIPSPITMTGGNCCTSVTFTASPSLTGAANIVLGQATGFSLPTANVNFPVTVGAASIAPQSTTVGINLETSLQFTLNGVANCSGGGQFLEFTLTSSNPQALLLSNGPTSAGTNTIQVPVVCGGSTSQYFYAQLVGGTVGQQLTYTVSGNGFPAGTGTITVGASGFVIAAGNGASPINPDFFRGVAGSGFTETIDVYSYLLDGTQQENPVTPQNVAPGASGNASFNVGIASSNTNVGTVAPSTVTISAGSFSNTTFFTPLAGGTSANPLTSNITVATIPSGFVAANSGYTTIEAIITNPSFSVPTSGLEVGQYLQTGASIGIGVAQPNDMVVQVVPNGQIALSATGTDAGTTGALQLTIPAGTNSVSFEIYGLGYNGTATFTVSYVSGGGPNLKYSPATGTVTLEPSGIALVGINLGNGQQLFTSATDSQTYGQPNFTVEVGILNGDNSFFTQQAMMGSVTATATISASAGTVGSPGATSTQVTIPNSGSLSVPYTPPNSPGATPTINLTAVSGPNAGSTVTATSTQSVINVHVEP